MSKIKLLIIVTFFLLFARAGFSVDQVWSTLILKYKATEKTHATVMTQQYIAMPNASLLLHLLDIGIGHQLTDFFGVGVVSRMYYTSADKLVLVPMLDFPFTFKLGDWKFTDRLRFESNIFSSGHSTKFRNFFGIDTPAFTPIKLALYASDEIFISPLDNFNTIAFSRNWLTAGVKFAPADKLGMACYYLWAADQISENWSHAHVLGITLVLALN